MGKGAFSHEPAAGEPPKQHWSKIDEQKFSLFQISENPYQNFPSATFTKEEYMMAAEEGYRGPNVLAFVNTKAAMEREEKASVTNHTQSNTHFYRHPNVDISHNPSPHVGRYLGASPGNREVEDSRPTSSIDDRMSFRIQHSSQNPYVTDSHSINSHSSGTPMEDAQEVSVARAGPGTDTPTTAINVVKEENTSKVSSGSEYHSCIDGGKPSLLSFYHGMLKANRPREPINPFSGKKPTLAAPPVKSMEHPESPTTLVESSQPQTSKYSKEREHPLQSKWSSPPTPVTPPPKFNPHGRTKSSDSMRSPTVKRGRGNSLLPESPPTSRGSKGKGKVTDPALSPSERGFAIATALRALDGNSVATTRNQVVKSPPRNYVSEGMQTDGSESRYSAESDENTFTGTGLFQALLPIWPSGIPENVLSALPELMDHTPFSPGPFMPLYAGRRPIPANCPKSHRYLAYLAEQLASFRTQLDEYQNQAVQFVHNQRNMENDLNMMQDERMHLSGENQVLRAYCKDLERLLKHVSGQRATPEELAPVFLIAQRLGLTIPGPGLADSNSVALAQQHDMGSGLSNLVDGYTKGQSKEMLDTLIQNIKLQQEVEAANKEAGIWKHRSQTWEKKFSKEVGRAALSLYGDMGDNQSHLASKYSTKMFAKHNEQLQMTIRPLTDSRGKAPERDIGAGAGPSYIHPQQTYSHFAGGSYMHPPEYQRNGSANVLFGYPPADPAVNGPPNMPNHYGGPHNSH